MGGYGALRLGLKSPYRFGSVYAQSPGVFDRAFLDEYATDLTPEQKADANVFAHTTRIAALPSRPVLSFDCGLDDPLLPRTRAFHEHLLSIEFPHQYTELAGGHTWEFWDGRIPSTLQQHIDVQTALACAASRL
jgi:enterochelin esterase-like enzyme